MKKAFRLLISIATATFVISQLSAQSNEWITLIDGTEGMDNFNVVGDANWHTDAASIRATQGSGASWLVTKESYSNFVLRVEFWASHDANSGIYMRCQEPTRITISGLIFPMAQVELFMLRQLKSLIQRLETNGALTKLQPTAIVCWLN